MVAARTRQKFWSLVKRAPAANLRELGIVAREIARMEYRELGPEKVALLVLRDSGKPDWTEAVVKGCQAVLWIMVPWCIGCHGVIFARWIGWMP